MIAFIIFIAKVAGGIAATAAIFVALAAFLDLLLP